MKHNSPNDLRLLFWESTARCNLSCKHCRRLDPADTEELATEEVRRVFESAAALGRPLIIFSGGEPLMRSDWEELADFARSLKLPTALATNGTLIDSAVAQRIASAGFHRVSVSLDGAAPAVHDEFRGIDGAFDDALSGIAAMNECDQSVQVNVTVASHNIHQLDAMYELSKSVGAVAMHLFLLVPVGCGLEIEASHQLDPDRYEQVLHWICDRQEQGEMELRATCAPHYYRVAAERGMQIARGRGCLCGLSVVFVSHKGEVFPCGYLPVRCGSVRQTPLDEIWANSQVLNDLRDFDKLKGKCGRCEHKDICGGCRARAFAAGGDMLGAEPFCRHVPATK